MPPTGEGVAGAMLDMVEKVEMVDMVDSLNADSRNDDEDSLNEDVDSRNEDVESLNVDVDSLKGEKDELRPSVDEAPKLGLRPPSFPPVATNFCINGLGEGEKEAPDDSLRPDAVALADNGEPDLLAGLAFRDAESRYLGGVTYVEPGVSDCVDEGSSPSSERCVGVKGMSAKLSFGRKRGYNATSIFSAKMSRRASNDRSGYVGSWLMF